jgi:hypothetical protein
MQINPSKRVPGMFQFCAKTRCQNVASADKPKGKQSDFTGSLSLGITSCFYDFGLDAAVRIRSPPPIS